MIDDVSEGSFQFQNQPFQGDIGIKGPQDYASPQSGFQETSYQPPMSPPVPYYPPGTGPRFPLIPVSPYSKGLAISVVIMVIGAILEKVFIQGDYYYYYRHIEQNPFYLLGILLFYIGGIMVFLFALGLFLLPPRQEQSSRESSNIHLGLAFLLGAIIIALALH